MTFIAPIIGLGLWFGFIWTLLHKESWFAGPKVVLPPEEKEETKKLPVGTGCRPHV